MNTGRDAEDMELDMYIQTEHEKSSKLMNKG